MRRFVVVLMSMLVLGGAAVAGTLAPATARPSAATKVVIVRPVGAAGYPQPGITVSSGGRFPIDCRSPEPSPAAVSRNIEFCFPTAAYAVACWKAAAAHKALCMQDPRQPQLVRFRRIGRFHPTPLAPARQRAPLGIRLGDGDYCAIRSGGAWSPPPGHPHLAGYYSCGHDGAVWAQFDAAHGGIDESQPTWTVRTAQFTSHRLVTRRVVRAWFVGTATR